jgi:hypothetical protein
MSLRKPSTHAWLIGGILVLASSFVILQANGRGRRKASSGPSPLSQSAPEKGSLKGLQGVNIVIEQVKPNVQHIITKEQARAIVEARLRLNGIPILH